MNFLVAVDGSSESVHALEFAMDVAAAADATLTVVHVVAPETRLEAGTTAIRSFSEAEQKIVREGLSDAEDRGGRIIDEARSVAEERDLPVDTQLLYGEPVSQLIAYAEETDADAIFVGHRGLSEKYEALVGSVAKELVERASIPVTVVR